MKYLRKFETSAAYEAAESTLAKPNVSYIVEGNTVEYKPQLPPSPAQIITYSASAKLTETTVWNLSGLHTGQFNTTIKSHTFENGVGTIVFDDDVTSIGYRAFYQCYGLTSIDMPNSVTEIGSGAFQSCGGLVSIIIPDSVTSIGDAAFNGCTSLTNITIGSGVTSIGSGSNVFNGCSSLESITCKATTAPTVGTNTFQKIKTDGTLYVPAGSTGYGKWMWTTNYYLGLYNWTKVEQ